jgi:hypothetical protein
MSDIESTTSKPWYTQFRKYFTLAYRYIVAFETWEEGPKKAAYENFENETRARFIFESNNIEREGLPFGQTKELVFSGLKELMAQRKIRPFKAENEKGLSSMSEFFKSKLFADFSYYPIQDSLYGDFEEFDKEPKSSISYILEFRLIFESKGRPVRTSRPVAKLRNV